MATVRVACPACGKKYKVAEEQLQRRVLCKECGHSFVPAHARVDERTEGDRPAIGAQWYVEINGRQTGPHPSDKVLALIQGGQVTADSLAWRQGMDKWQPLKSISEFAAAIPPGPIGAPVEDPAKRGAATAAVVGAQAVKSDGFFSHLFDFSFSHFVMMRVVRVLYALVIFACVIIFFAIMAATILAAVEQGPPALVGSVILGSIFGALIAFLYLLLGRLWLEMVVVAFRIAEDTRTIAKHTAIIVERQES